MSLDAPDELHLRAAHGYIELDLFEDADAELEEIDPFCRHLPEVLLARLAIYHGLKKWDLMAVVAKRLTEFNPREPGFFVELAYAIRRAESIHAAHAILTRAASILTDRDRDGTQVTVNLIKVSNVQTITVTLSGVSDGTNTYTIPVPMGILIGDTTSNGLVNPEDIRQTQSQFGQAITALNFREDVNANGSISGSDVSLVASKLGTSLP